jgi:hypothetical protein
MDAVPRSVGSSVGCHHGKIIAGESAFRSAGDVMTIEKVREASSAGPFQPFVLHLADGRNTTVRHPENLAFSPSGRTIHVYLPDDTSHFVDLLLVTDLEIQSATRGPSERIRS